MYEIIASFICWLDKILGSSFWAISLLDDTIIFLPKLGHRSLAKKSFVLFREYFFYKHKQIQAKPFFSESEIFCCGITDPSDIEEKKTISTNDILNSLKERDPVLEILRFCSDNNRCKIIVVQVWNFQPPGRKLHSGARRLKLKLHCCSSDFVHKKIGKD